MKHFLRNYIKYIIPAAVFMLSLVSYASYALPETSLAHDSNRPDMELIDPTVRCYPNPATSYINFTFERAVPSGAKLAIYSFTGRKMAEIPVVNDKLQVSLENYFRGLYLFQLVKRNGEVVETGKFQVLK